MSSTASVNFSVRQNKAIERQIVVDGMGRILTALELKKVMYVGLGSVWFTDFTMVHKALGIQDMHSIEADPVVFARAEFNRPYRTLRVHEGRSSDVVRELLARPTYLTRPWIVWLDFDGVLERDNVLEFNKLLRDLPPNSFLLTTFCAQPSRYGGLANRSQLLGELLGYEVSPVPAVADLKAADRFPLLLANLLEQHFVSTAIGQARPGGYLPAFRIGYRDGSPMTTVGGFLPDPQRLEAAQSVLNAQDWIGRPDRPIITAPLTAKEVATLQSKLPSRTPLTRSKVRSMGFDLEDQQIELFEEHYNRFPAFAQLAY